MAQSVFLACLALAILEMFCQSARAEVVEYTAADTARLVESGRAPAHGAQFAVHRGALGVQSHLWKKSEDEHVFVFSRNGKFYGEFRHETLFGVKRQFAEITEHYLVRGSRKAPAFPPGGALPYLRKVTRLHWDKGVWIGSKVTWTFMWCTEDGAVTRSEAPYIEETLRQEIRVRVPAALRLMAGEYYVSAYKAARSEHEEALGTMPDPDGLGVRLGTEQLDHGECTLSVEVPMSRPAIVLELQARPIRHDSETPQSFEEIKRVAVMKVESLPAETEIIKFTQP